MAENDHRFQSSRNIQGRYVIHFVLTLQTPAMFGSGNTDDLLDISIQRDPESEDPLLTGSSIAGALRSHLCDQLFGYRDVYKLNGEDSRESLLFGGNRTDPYGEQSPLIAFDSIGRIPDEQNTIIRDGVAVRLDTGTAKDGAKYEYELLPENTSFPIRVDVWKTEKNQEDIITLIYYSLHGFEDGSIRLGGRKSRGFGLVSANQWSIVYYDFTKIDGLIKWLKRVEIPYNLDENAQPSNNRYWSKLDQAIASLGISPNNLVDRRSYFKVEITCKQTSGLIIHSAPDPMVDAYADIDSIHLHSNNTPVIPGTSIAGVLRNRALRIAYVLFDEYKDEPIQRLEDFIESIFGGRLSDDQHQEERKESDLASSRLLIEEIPLENHTSYNQTRISIDRFTGGTRKGALFNERPLLDGTTAFKIILKNATEAEIGLLLLLVKDLCTDDLTFGGNASIGRGRFLGVEANIKYKKPRELVKKWSWRQNRYGDIQVDINCANEMQYFVNSLINSLQMEKDYEN